MWCCEHENVCFGVTPQAPAGPTVPDGPEDLAAATGEGGCEKTCSVGNQVATCTSRMNWLVTHRLRATDNACSVALQQVLSQCPMCHGCTVPAADCHAAAPYDCHEQQTSMVWSPSKQTWCCQQHSIGCKSPSEAHYDCDEGWSNWENGWAIKKKAWCCIHAGKACPPADTMAKLPFASMTYDCDDGFTNWENEWSVGKKAWCCINQRRGCDQ
jgi:hypothetical protein